MRRLPQALALVVGVATVAAHVLFVVRDPRLPRDLGVYYQLLPELYDALGSEGALSAALSALAQSSGWYNLLMAALMRLTGVAVEVFRAFDVLWLAVILACTWWLARRSSGEERGGEWSGLAALSLVASLPAVFVTARTGWIHVPEAALVLLAAVAWVADPGLERWCTVAAVAVLGALTIALRPSGLVWVPTLVLVLWDGWSRLRWPRLGAVMAGWGLGALVHMDIIAAYLTQKTASRELYSAYLPAVWQQLGYDLGPLAMVPLGLGLVLLGVWAVRQRPRVSGTALLLASWVAGPLALWLLFQAGLDNFTLFGPALAVAAGVGVGRVLPRAGAGLAGVVWVVVSLPQWLPIPPPGSHLVGLPGLGPLVAGPTITNYYRPFDGLGAAQVGALLDATCPEPEPLTCHLVVDQGLFYPFVEEAGHLELFFMQESRVVLHPLQFSHEAELEEVDVLSEYHCGERDAQWRDRYPGSRERLEELVHSQGLRPAWWTEVSPGCALLWFTRDGRVEHTELLPPMPLHMQGRPPPASGALSR